MTRPAKSPNGLVTRSLCGGMTALICTFFLIDPAALIDLSPVAAAAPLLVTIHRRHQCAKAQSQAAGTCFLFARSPPRYS